MEWEDAHPGGFISREELLAELDAYSLSVARGEIGEHGSAVVMEFDEDLLSDPTVDDGGDSGAASQLGGYAATGPDTLSVSASAPRIALSTPKPAPPSSLYSRLVKELDFPEASSVLTLLDKSNYDLFSCFPTNESIYENAAMLSSSAEEVVLAAESYSAGKRGRREDVDLNAHGPLALPNPPETEGDLVRYVESVQEFFRSELEARERMYARLLYGYCAALVGYMRASSNKEVRGCRAKDVAGEARARLERMITDRYYREVARMAKVLYLHLYLNTSREVSSRLYASQIRNQSVFAFLRYEWTQNRQFTCLFQPVLFNHGVVILEKDALMPKRLRELNYVRNALSLPLLRCGLVEEPGKPIIDTPEFSGSLPRASGYLLHLIRTKMEAYSKTHPRIPAYPAKEHSYYKRTDQANYGSSCEAMLDPPSPETVLPCDPCPPTTVSLISSTRADDGGGRKRRGSEDNALLSKILTF